MKSQLEWITANLASVAIIAANVIDVLPTLVGVVGGVAVAWYNIEKAVSERKKRKNNE